MPVIIEANGEKFEFDDGVTDDQISEALDEYFVGKNKDEANRLVESDMPLSDNWKDYTDKNVISEVEKIEADKQAERIRNQPTLGDKVLGALDAASVAGSATTGGTIGTMLGTVEAIFKQATGQLQGEKPEDIIQRSASNLTFEPRTEYGRELLKDLSKTVGMLPPVLGIAPLSSIGQSTRAASKAAGVDKPFNIITDANKTKAQLVEELKAGNVDAGNIAKALDANGNLIKNKNLKAAIKLMGDDESAYGMAINLEKMNKPTKKRFNQMLDTIESNYKSKDPTLIMENRPANVIGESLADKILQVDKIKKSANKQIKTAIEKDLTGKKVNTLPTFDKLNNALSENGITVFKDDNGRFKINDQDSLVTLGNDTSKAKIETLVNHLSRGDIDAPSAHKLKKLIRESVNFDPTGPKNANTGIEIERALKGVASDINTQLGELSPRYKSGNKKFSEVIDGLNKADKMLGKNLMIGDDLADAKLGSLSKRIGSNLSSREQPIMLVRELDRVLGKDNENSLDDIARQVAAVADLEKIFKVENEQAPFGFSAGITKGINAAANPSGATMQLIDSAVEGFKNMNKMDFDQKMKALRKLSEVKE